MTNYTFPEVKFCKRFNLIISYFEVNGPPNARAFGRRPKPKGNSTRLENILFPRRVVIYDVMLLSMRRQSALQKSAMCETKRNAANDK